MIYRIFAGLFLVGYGLSALGLPIPSVVLAVCALVGGTALLAAA